MLFRFFTLFLIVFFSGIYTNVFAQTIISGYTKDQLNNSLGFTQVILYQNDNSQILEYLKSDSEGNFRFNQSYTHGIYRLEAAYLGYEKYSKIIVIGTDKQKEIFIEAVLINPKSIEIHEVNVNANYPVIVKEDTTIYRIEHFTDIADESLEQVLSNIPGFRVEPNGEILVNGKQIRKVLIDGKEVSDLGASLITKSLSPDDIKEIEVRFDEKNLKLKESLLNDEKFVVLDIKLKHNLNKSFFGQTTGELSLAGNLKPVAYGNLFSLNKKLNLQFFAERNTLGDNKIRLENIRNIGEEALLQIMDIPADYNEIKQRRGYHKEMFGFKNYTKTDNSILGISLNIPVNDKLDFYFGSFNTYNEIRNYSLFTQRYDNEIINKLTQESSPFFYDSKSKLQIKYTSRKVKINTDLNYIFSDNYSRIAANSWTAKDLYLFKNKYKSGSVFYNLSSEYKINKIFGIKYKISAVSDYYERKMELVQSDSIFGTFLNSYYSDGNYGFIQKITARENKFFNELTLIIKPKNGTHSIGYRYNYQDIILSKTTDNHLDEYNKFNLDNEHFIKQLNSILYGYQRAIGPLLLNFKLDIAHLQVTPQIANIAVLYPQYSASLNIPLSENHNINLVYSKSLDRYPLHKLDSGFTLLDYMLVYSGKREIRPSYNQSFQLSFDSRLPELGIDFLNGILWGKGNNGDNILYAGNFFIRQADYMPLGFFLYSLSVKKSFKKLPLQLSFEPEYFSNSSGYKLNENIIDQTTRRYLLGLKAYVEIKRFADLIFYPKYTLFSFSLDNKKLPSGNYSFLSEQLIFRMKFYNEKLLIENTLRDVMFVNKASERFTQWDIRISLNLKNKRLYFVGSNLLNNTNFIITEFDNLFVSESYSSVFGRYFGFGVNCKF